MFKTNKILAERVVRLVYKPSSSASQTTWNHTTTSLPGSLVFTFRSKDHIYPKFSMAAPTFGKHLQVLFRAGLLFIPFIWSVLHLITGVGIIYILLINTNNWPISITGLPFSFMKKNTLHVIYMTIILYYYRTFLPRMHHNPLCCHSSLATR